MKRCIVGRFPPPIGGVSVYTKRKFEKLKGEGVSVSKIDFSNKLFPFLIMRAKNTEFEVNSINLVVLFIFFLTNQISNAVFVDHNASISFSGFKKNLLLFFLKKAKSICVVNDELKKFYPMAFSVEVVSPFIAPCENEEQEILRSYPPGVIEFLSQKKVMVNSAWKYLPYKKTDLYGLADSVALLKNNNDLKLLLAIGRYEPELMPKSLSKDIADLCSEKRLFLLTGQKQLWPVFKYRPLYLRLTPYDGDSVSVREAIYFGCNVVASNSISRPLECKLYDYNNSTDLLQAIRKYIN
jgi:hypothetical protein